MSMYIIKHVYDVDGGLGDAIEREDVVGVVDCTKAELDAFLKEYNKPIVYDEPYNWITCHTLIAEEIEVKTLASIEKDPYGDDGAYELLAAFFKQRDPERFEHCQEVLKEQLKED